MVYCGMCKTTTGFTLVPVCEQLLTFLARVYKESALVCAGQLRVFQ